MPTRPLVTRYEDDLTLVADLWGKVGFALALVVVLAFPFVAGPRWLTVGNMALVAVVGTAGERYAEWRHRDRRSLELVDELAG